MNEHSKGMIFQRSFLVAHQWWYAPQKSKRSLSTHFIARSIWRGVVACFEKRQSRSVFYKWKASQERKENDRDYDDLLSTICEIYDASGGIYGYRRMDKTLRNRGSSSTINDCNASFGRMICSQSFMLSAKINGRFKAKRKTCCDKTSKQTGPTRNGQPTLPTYASYLNRIIWCALWIYTMETSFATKFFRQWKLQTQ